MTTDAENLMVSWNSTRDYLMKKAENLTNLEKLQLHGIYEFAWYNARTMGCDLVSSQTLAERACLIHIAEHEPK